MRERGKDTWWQEERERKGERKDRRKGGRARGIR